MADRPIPYSAPMIRALQREIEAPGTGKTQTRRTHAPAPRFAPDGCRQPDLGGRACWWEFWASDRAETHRFKLPYAVGDRLYVREHWRTSDAYDDLAPSQMGGEEQVIYLADDAMETWGWSNRFVPGRFRQGMHMPRWASRITLLVTDVRVERLQNCSEADAVAEGVESDGYGGWLCYASEPKGQTYWADPRESYRTLWNSLQGPGAWEANPWVAAYTFTVARGNIDQQGAH